MTRLPVAVWRLDLLEPGSVGGYDEAAVEALLHASRLGYANPATARLLGVPDGDQLLGRSLAALFPALVSRDRDMLRRFLSSRYELDGLELRLSDRDGRILYCRSAWVGIAGAGGLRAVWGTLENVTAERELRQQLAAATEHQSDEIVGRSPAIRRTLEKIEQVAPTDSTVLITGETGSGKELIARAIHRRSRRADKPLVTVNCGAVAAGLVESELFGHEKGSFTGATGRKIGRFELADGGTLFLDEIGDLPLEAQVKLLRVLQEGEITRVGGAAAIEVDVRVIAATHRDLAAAVQAGTFRQDLYYRLNVFPIRSPALRERREDIPMLVAHLVNRYATRLGRRIEVIPPGVLDALARHPWPGNIRELANIIERSVIVSDGPALQLGEWVTGQYAPIAPDPSSAPRSLEEMERRHIVQTLERTGWKVSGPGGAAEALSLKPTTLEARMKKLGITRPGRR
ncbi:MAG TPA: sigma 54-interacting transcriptional regulator [Gemmatimonadales bacterium]|nr:sigma 54-interacting transcriptional regulator [Gemmatimonadales bacterium]